ncbi:virulence RhuM family protein [bacterium]|nr:virulence RhuM family protein [bacterium]
MQNSEPTNQIIIYESSAGKPNIEVRVEGETVWLTQAQLVDLFDSSKANVSEHIKHIFEEAELQRDSVVRKFRTTAKDGKNYNIEYYNLDLIISLGYRVKSQIATKFRQWATVRLREYIIKGFTMDDERLKEMGGGNYWKELLDRIRDIRSSEKVLYRQVLDLFATSQDYSAKSKESIAFFKVVQNKLHYAAHGNTAAEVIAKRADAGKPFMGLLTFSGGDVSKKDIATAKNYLIESELKILNNIVSAYFDLAEVKAMNAEPMQMQDWIIQLDRMIETFDKKVLTDAGSISHKEAIIKAEAQYKEYQTQTLSEVERAYLDSITAVAKKVKTKIRSTKS